MISISNPQEPSTTNQCYTVLLNGDIVASITSGQTQRINLPNSGAHEIWISQGTTVSNKLSFAYNAKPIGFAFSKSSEMSIELQISPFHPLVEF